jgi:hypothetical protein
VIRRIALLLPALAAFAAPAFAAESWPHFVRTGDTLVCQAAADKPATDSTPCLKIGEMAIGTRRTTAEFRLGKPVQTIQMGGETFFAYPLVYSNEGEGLSADHFAATSATVSYAADRTISSFQVKGKPISHAWQFCGLGLGDSEAALRARLGDPLATNAGSEPGATVFSYGDSIAIGVSDGKISSIRIAKSGG